MSASGHVGQAADATPAPLLIRRPGHAALGTLVLAIASLWLAAAIPGVLPGSPDVIPGLGSSGAYWAGAVGAALAMLGLHWIVGRQTVLTDRGALVVTERSLLGDHTWREPLANYREMRGRVEQRSHRYGRRTWYVVRLWHPEPAKRVELARTRNPAAVEARVCDCAGRFGLPLVWEQPRSTIVDQAGVHVADRRARGGSRGEIATAAVPGQSLSAN